MGVTCRGFRGGSSGGRKQTRARTHLHSVLGRGATANLEGTALGVVQKRFPSPTPRQDSHKDGSVHRSVKVWGRETQYGAKKDGEGKMRFLMDSMISINPRVSLIPGASTQPTRKERKHRLPETHPLLGLTRVTVSWPERM